MLRFVIRDMDILANWGTCFLKRAGNIHYYIYKSNNIFKAPSNPPIGGKTYGAVKNEI